MPSSNKFPGPLPILMIVIALAAACTWLLPAGQYQKLSYTDSKNFSLSSDSVEHSLPATQKTLDSLGIRIALEKFTSGSIRKPVSVPGTFQKQKSNGQGLLAILQAPVKGIIDSVDIILFVLIIGGFIYVFTETKAMEKGIVWLSHRMRGREQWLIIVLTFIFSFFGASYGMAEEALTFYPLLVPLFLAAGYDMLVPLAVIFGGTTVGGLSGFSNPFSVIIASNAAGISWKDGLNERLLMFVISTGILIWYNLRYAKKVKENPAVSLLLKTDGKVQLPSFALAIDNNAPKPKLNAKNILLLLIFIGSFLSMIAGVVFLDWWTTELSTLFLASSILVAVIAGINEKIFVQEFLKGAESLLSVAFIIGVARGVTIVLNEGHISDSILFYTANLVQGLSPALFMIIILVFYLLFSLFIQSSSGMAVLTMPIIGALAFMLSIPGREIVNAYIFGMSIMSFVAPTGLILPNLAITNISYKAWLKYANPLIIAYIIICIAFLLVGTL